MSEVLAHITLPEHWSFPIANEIPVVINSIFFKEKSDCKCIEIIQNDNSKTLLSSYYIGIDWLVKNELAIGVSPKINNSVEEVDYVKMLFSCLRHLDVSKFTSDLYDIKFNQPEITIDHKDDLITPLLIGIYLKVLTSIVRKGLKSAYYRVESNLTGRIRGKIMVSETLKSNVFKNKLTSTYCRFDEFGIDNTENRILKMALRFSQQYLTRFPREYRQLEHLMSFCLPFFESVSDLAQVQDIKQTKHNVFFKEYEEGLRLASLILRRFGYNISRAATKSSKTKVPPFWIDMPKLFELYVLGLLKDRFNKEIRFQEQGTYGRPDYLLNLNGVKIIADAKYKLKYQEEAYWAEDIRQLSGYARDQRILEKLGFEDCNHIVECVIIYPDQGASEILEDDLMRYPIAGFRKFYKTAIKLPSRFLSI